MIKYEFLAKVFKDYYEKNRTSQDNPASEEHINNKMINFAYFSIKHYLENTTEENNIFKAGVTVFKKLDPISKAQLLYIGTKEYSERITYFSIKDGNEYLWFDFERFSFSEWWESEVAPIFIAREEVDVSKIKEKVSFFATHIAYYLDYSAEIYLDFSNGGKTLSICSCPWESEEDEDEDEWLNLDDELYRYNIRVHREEEEQDQDIVAKNFYHTSFLSDVDKIIMNEITISATDTKENFNFGSYEKNFNFIVGPVYAIKREGRPCIPLKTNGNIMNFIDPMKVDLGLEISLDNPNLDTRSVLRSYASDAAHPFHEALKTKGLKRVDVIVKHKK